MRERPYYSITVVWLKSPNNSDKKVLEAMEIFHLSGGEIRKIADQTRETNREQLPVRPPKDSNVTQSTERDSNSLKYYGSSFLQSIFGRRCRSEG